MIIVLLKFFHMLKIQMKQNINILLNNVKIMEASKIQRLSLNIQIICRMSIKMLKSTTQAENVTY